MARPKKYKNPALDLFDEAIITQSVLTRLW